MATGFVHLHVHSEHSELDSTARVADIIAAAKDDGQPAVAITDHGTLAGIYTAMQEGKRAGVKVIPGIEAYLAIGSRHERNTIEVPAEGATTDSAEEVRGSTKVKKYDHLTILATNRTGWANLVAMHNASQHSRWGKHPRIDYELLAEHAEGLVVLTGCLGGPVMGPLSRGDEAAARQGLEAIIEAVGKDNVYVEVMEHGIDQETVTLPKLAKLAKSYGLPMVATNDSHHVHADGAYAHEAWLAMQTQKTLAHPSPPRFAFDGTGYHMRTAAQMRAVRSEKWWAKACDNTVELAARVSPDMMPEHYLRLPKFPVPEGFEDSREYLIHLVKEGAKQRWGDPYPREVAERLNAELRVYTELGVIDYCLIVHELITWARSQGIPVGPGRGSSAGSAVSYALGIVGVDPLRFDLLFERFLDPTRVGMPDIDIDFPKERRDEVLAHLVDMYGEDFVARIGTFQVAKTKASLKSAARVLSHPASLGDRLSKILPMKGVEALPFSELDKRRSEEAAGFWEAVDADPRAQEVVELARQFEHVITGPSIHACGVVISDVPLTNLVPMRKDTGKGSTEDDPLVTEWDAAGVDDGIGLLKLDVLGLRTMDIVAAAARNVEELTGEHIDIDQLPDGDDLDNERVAKTWQLISRGHTEGLFQLESRGMTELAQDVRPASMEHLAALVALFRPGPLSADMHTRYAARKNGREEVDYGIFTDDPAEQEQIARVLDTTYGVAVYQEQYMRLGDVVAGFGPAERNRLRKAVSKKIAAEVDAVGELFIAGATSDEASDGSSKLAFSARTAQRVWDAIKGGADYVFNKSHAVAYGQLAYVTAFLKANWPAAFGAAVLSHTDDDEKRAAALAALSQEGIKVLPPQVNSGQVSTTARDTETVVLGLGEIAGVGMAARAIVAERDAGGPFTCAADILNRTVMPGKEPGQHSKLTVTTVEALIEAGALDEFGPRQGQMRVLRAKADRPDTVVPGDEWGLVERAVRQHQRLGLSLGRHPMSALSDQVRRWNPDQHDESGRPLSLKPMGLHKVLSSGKSDVATVGLVTGWRVKADNRGGQRADLRLEGSKGRIEAVVWDNTLRWLRRSGHEVGVGSVVGVRARVRAREIEQQDEEGNTVITTVHSLTVVKMWPIDYTDVDATVDRTDLGLDLAGLLYNPDKPMLSLVPGTTGKQSAKVSPDRPGKAPKDRKAKDKPRPTQPVGTDEAVLVLRYGAVPTTGRPWLVKTHPEVADAPAEYADPHEQVRVFRVPAASSPQSQQRPPLYVVALPPGADPGDPKWQQIELPAHPDDTQWQPVDYSRWEVFHPDVRPALVAV